MAETSSPCLVRSFSQPSSKSYDGHEEDLLRALSSSISFGRYMSESLAWEKWSAFSSHNKYREEAERYSRPGSVAEKKAFFEARYKKIAAKRAAASVEQPSGGADDHHSSDLSYEAAENAKDVSTEGEEVSNAEVSVTSGCYADTEMAKQSTEQPVFIENQVGSMKQEGVDRGVDKNRPCQDEKMDTKGIVAMGVSLVSREAMATKPSTKCGLPKPPPPVKPPSIQSKKTENSTTPTSIKHTAKVSAIKNQLAPRSLHVPANFERDEPIKTSSPILQKIVNSKLVRAITNSIQESRSQKSPIKESGISLSKNVTPEPDVRVCMGSESAENVNRVVTEEKRGEELPNAAVPKQTEQLTFSNDSVEKPKEIDRGIDKNLACLDEKMNTQGAVTKGDSLVSDETTHSSTATKPSTKCGLSKHRPDKQPSIQSKKTEHSTPSRVHTTKGCTIKSQSAALSLLLSGNVECDEPIKPSSPMLQRIVNSKFVRAITNTTRESRPQKSPFRASSYSSSKHVTSEPDSRRTITLPDSSLSRSRITPSTGNLKSPTAHGSKTQPSSTTCSSFVFRSEERAIKRKEFYQKLEQKLKEEQQLQTKAMSKRTNEPTASSACAPRAKPNATNHHTRDPSGNPTKKVPETAQPSSPKLGKKPVSRVQENGSRPPWRLPGKSESLKDVVGKTNKPFIHSTKLFLKESRHENASPNIQQ
nr:protein WVD2-like 7 isoform X2 [Ipomoea batatas]